MATSEVKTCDGLKMSWIDAEEVKKERKEGRTDKIKRGTQAAISPAG